MNLSNELIKYVTNSNSKIVKQLVDIINSKKINSMEELKNYEDRLFTINGKILENNERIQYCYDMYEKFSFEYDDLSFSECKLERKYYDELNENFDNEYKIELLIKLFSLTGREIYFLTEAYNLIINQKL